MKKLYIYDNQRVISHMPLTDGKSISGKLVKEGNNIDFTPAIRHGENPLVAETDHFRMRLAKTGLRITGTLTDLHCADANKLAREVKLLVKNAAEA